MFIGRIVGALTLLGVIAAGLNAVFFKNISLFAKGMTLLGVLGMAWLLVTLLTGSGDD